MKGVNFVCDGSTGRGGKDSILCMLKVVYMMGVYLSCWFRLLLLLLLVPLLLLLLVGYTRAVCVLLLTEALLLV